MKDGLKDDRGIIVALGFLLIFLWINNPSAQNVLIPNLFFLALTFFVYNSKDYSKHLIGFQGKTLINSILYGGITIGAFWFATSFIPGMSLVYPLLPQAISETMKFLTIVLIIPPIEEIVFRGALLGFLRSFIKKSEWIPIIISSVIFSLFHLTAYISGWYQLPDIAAGIGAIGANLSVFITAFVFGVIASYFVSRKGINNLAYSTVFHMGMNALAYGLAVAVFV